MTAGTRLYETIANNRRFAGNFTKPFTYQSFTVRSASFLSLIPLMILVFTALLNLRSIAADVALASPPQRLLQQVTHNPAVKILMPLGQAARLDQSWRIFTPLPNDD